MRIFRDSVPKVEDRRVIRVLRIMVIIIIMECGLVGDEGRRGE
jgi:hypothetical protein